MGHPGAHSLANEVPLELRYSSHDVEEKLSARGGGIDAFGIADEIDPEGAELIEAFDQVLQRTGEAVELPDQDHIEETLAGVLHQHIELGAVALGPAHTNIYILAVLSETLAGVAPKVLELHLAVLVERADPGVQRSGLHSETSVMFLFSRRIDSRPL